MSQTLLVVPCYNEESRLPADRLLEYAATRDWLRYLLVDDGSKDGTRALLERTRERDPAHVGVLGLDVNGGKAEAVRRGFLHGIDTFKPDYIGFWDADLATPLDELEGFVGILDRHPEVEMVLGSRVQLLGRHIDRDRKRHYFGRVAATAVSNMLGLRVYDTQCGAKLFRVTPNLRDIFAEPFLTRWIFDVEILARWMKLQDPAEDKRVQEARIHEVPLREWQDVKGSRLKPTDFMKAPMELARIWRHYFG